MNQVILMGRLTETPQLKTTLNGTAITSFVLAVNRKFVNADKTRETDFIKVVAWRNNAQFIERYFRKGQMMAVVGSLQTRSYKDKDGKNRIVSEVVVDSAYFCGDKKNNTGEGTPAASAANTPTNTLSEPESYPTTTFSTPDEDFEDISDYDDELPF